MHSMMLDKNIPQRITADMICTVYCTNEGEDRDLSSLLQIHIDLRHQSVDAHGYFQSSLILTSHCCGKKHVSKVVRYVMFTVTEIF